MHMIWQKAAAADIANACVQAIAALNLTAPDPGQLYNVVSYHYCPAEKDDAQALLVRPAKCHVLF
jgi:hypothetical protein